MQLKKPVSISAALSAATYTLLSQAAEKTWDMDASALVYSERNRVTVNEDVVRAKIDQGNEKTFTLTGIIDVMTGASPTGASKLGMGQSFTSPSGGKFQSDANQTPIAEFNDTRVAVHAAWDRPWAKNARATYGADYSDEKDYSSLGGSFNLVGDFFDKMTSLTVGTAANYDTIRPIKGVPISLTPAINKLGADESDRKIGIQGLVGITQVINRRTLVQFNYTLANQSGYLTDPYKVVSYGNAQANSLGNYYFELRPDSRTSHVFYGKLNYALDDGSFISYSGRYYRDDWNVRAATAEMKYDQPLKTPGEWAGVHARFSRQGRARFYHYQLTDDPSSPDYIGKNVPFNETKSLREHFRDEYYYVSSDYRLASIDSFTVGAKYRRPVDWFDTKMILDARAEGLAQFDRAKQLDPLYAVILQIALRFKY